MTCRLCQQRVVYEYGRMKNHFSDFHRNDMDLYQYYKRFVHHRGGVKREVKEEPREREESDETSDTKRRRLSESVTVNQTHPDPRPLAVLNGNRVASQEGGSGSLQTRPEEVQSSSRHQPVQKTGRFQGSYESPSRVNAEMNKKRPGCDAKAKGQKSDEQRKRSPARVASQQGSSPGVREKSGASHDAEPVAQSKTKDAQLLSNRQLMHSSDQVKPRSQSSSSHSAPNAKPKDNSGAPQVPCSSTAVATSSSTLSTSLDRSNPASTASQIPASASAIVREVENRCIFNCSTCQASLASWRKLREHCRAEHQYDPQDAVAADASITREKWLAARNFHKCRTCSKLVLCDVDSISDHVKVHHGLSLQEYAGEKRQSQQQLQQQQQQQQENKEEESNLVKNLCVFRCSVCAVELSASTRILEHMRDSHGDRTTKVSSLVAKKVVFRCPIPHCDAAVLCDVKVIAVHVLSAHNLNLDDFRLMIGQPSSKQRSATQTNPSSRPTGPVQQTTPPLPTEQHDQQTFPPLHTDPTQELQLKAPLAIGPSPLLVHIEDWEERMRQPVPEQFANAPFSPTIQHSCAFPCPYCKRCFSDAVKIVKHLKNVHRIFNVSYNDLKKIASVVVLFSCPLSECLEVLLCDTKVILSHAFKAHQLNTFEMRHLLDPNPSSGLNLPQKDPSIKVHSVLANLCSFECNNCEMKTVSFASVKAHLKNKHDKGPRQDIEYRVTRKEWWECPMCLTVIICDRFMISAHTTSEHGIGIAEFEVLAAKYYLAKGVELPLPVEDDSILMEGVTDEVVDEVPVVEEPSNQSLEADQSHVPVRRRHSSGEALSFLSSQGHPVIDEPGSLCEYSCNLCPTKSVNYNAFKMHFKSHPLVAMGPKESYLTRVVLFRCLLCSGLMLCDRSEISKHLFSKHNRMTVEVFKRNIHEIKSKGADGVGDCDGAGGDDSIVCTPDIDPSSIVMPPVSKTSTCTTTTTTSHQQVNVDHTYHSGEGRQDDGKVTHIPGNKCVFGCAYCQKRLYSQCSLRTHLNTVHGLATMPFFELRMHVVTEVAYQCLLCGNSMMCDNVPILAHATNKHGLIAKDYRKRQHELMKRKELLCITDESGNCHQEADNVGPNNKGGGVCKDSMTAADGQPQLQTTTNR